ncbi:C39 family peptidase [Francisellaceae bacterium CB300]
MFKRLFFVTVVFFVLGIGYSDENTDRSYADFVDGIVKTFNLSSDKNIKMLNIKDYQQTTDITCGPAAVMSLLHYYGMLKDSDMNSKTELRIAKEMGTNEEYGTTLKQMTDWLKKQGYEVKYGNKGDIKLLYKNLDAGIPVLVDWIDWGGHWDLVSGYQKLGEAVDDDKDTMFMTDPAVHFNNVKTIYGLTAINPDRFQEMWQDSEGVKGIYIIAYPKESLEK